jgi:ribosome-binding factor A
VRVGDEMRHILANLFISEVFIPEAGLLTVTKVAVTDDLKIAKVYLSFLENKKPVEDVLEILESKHNLIRRLVGFKLTLKYIPKLQFYYDDSIEHAQRIDDLIQKIYKDD